MGKQVLNYFLVATIAGLAVLTSCNNTEKDEDNNNIAVTDVKISYYGNRLMEPNEEVDLTFGPTMYLFAVVSPENATNKNVTWKNSDENVATFTPVYVQDRVGIVALAEGRTTITVTTEDGKKTASCVVWVPLGGGFLSPTINMKVSYGTISDHNFTSGDVLHARKGTSLNFKINITQGSYPLKKFTITSWIEAESVSAIVLEENFDGKSEFEYTATAGNNTEVLFFEVLNSKDYAVTAQVNIEPY